MINFKSGAILALFLSTVSLLACAGGNKNADAPRATNTSRSVGENPNTARTNVEELSLLIRVPYETEDIVWKEDIANKKVIAVFRFSPVDSNQIVAEAERSGVPQNASIAVEPWFPDELTAQSDMSGDSSLKGLAYPATAFYQNPYSAGRITRIEGGDYFILELSAK